MSDKTRVLLVGYGRMGRLVDRLAAEYDCEIVGRVSEDDNHAGEGLAPDRWRDVEVAIDFTTAPAFLANLPRLLALGVNLVVGTTGWQAEADAVRRAAESAGIGAVTAANFSIGVTIFEAIVAEAGRLLGRREEYGAWIHELHHAAKKDAPSGTAVVLARALERGGYARHVDVASTRAGSIPGTHTVGFDAPSETIALTHTTRDRATFARGALLAARWVAGRRGWFTMKDVLELDPG
jgi:4-hydroxy-tetrahydrodipicolinate reductase